MVYIVSNADLKWIENCLIHFLPELNEYIRDKGIKIYSAKNMFSSTFSLGKWKVTYIPNIMPFNSQNASGKY